jgi:hypothetical protein
MTCQGAGMAIFFRFLQRNPSFLSPAADGGGKLLRGLKKVFHGFARGSDEPIFSAGKSFSLPTNKNLRPKLDSPPLF